MEIYQSRLQMFVGKKAGNVLPPVVVPTDASKLEGLREVFIKDLTQNKYTTGVFVRLRTVCPAAKSVETFTVVVDGQGSHSLLDLGCFIPSARLVSDVGAWLPEGTVLAVVNPYIKGNFRRDPCVANIFCNLLECVIVLSYPENSGPPPKAAKVAAKAKGKVPEKEMTREKLARDLFSRHDYKGATQILLFQTSGFPVLAPEERQLLREIETATGHYDFDFMMKEVPSMNMWDGLDHGCYTGPIWPDSSRKDGPHMVAERDLPPGTLLLAHKAISYTNGDDIAVQGDTLAGRDMSAYVHFLSLTTRAAKFLRKVMEDPSLAPTMAKVVSGATLTPDSKCEPILEEVGQYLRNNSHSMAQQLGPDLSSYSQGVWGKELTQLRHRCMLNTCAFSVGDFIFLYNLREVPKGTELTIRFGVCGWLRERELIASRYKFTCSCPLCEEDRSLTPDIRAKMVDLYNYFETLKETGGTSEEYEALLEKLLEPQFQGHKTQPYYPEVGEVAYEALKQRCNEGNYCHIDRLFGLALKNSSYGPESLRCFLSYSLLIQSAGLSELGDHLHKKTLRYANRVYGPTLCHLFTQAMKLK